MAWQSCVLPAVGLLVFQQARYPKNSNRSAIRCLSLFPFIGKIAEYSRNLIIAGNSRTLSMGQRHGVFVQLFLCVLLVQIDASMGAQTLPSTTSLNLTGISRIQNISNGYLEDFSGKQYDLTKLSPYHELLPPAENDEFGGKDQEGNETAVMPIYKAIFGDGTSLIAEKDANGEIIHAELKKQAQQPALYFVKTQECEENELLVFSESQVDDTEFQGLPFGDEEVPEDLWIPTSLANSVRVSLPDHIYTAGDRTSSECLYFKVVKIGVVYDAEFCRKYGGKTGARSRIMLIVAAASLLYENDMCTKLQLVDIYTPDNDCSAPSTFASMPRERACGSGANSETFIRFYADWMNDNRESLGLDPDAVFHAFTGFPPRGVLGCAYIGTVCRTPEYAYGVNYMTSNFLSTQSIVFAHELGHNLNARHLTTVEASGGRYIMKPALQNPNIGFSEVTIERILGYLDSDDVTCDTVAYPEATAVPTKAPSPLPSPVPSAWPSSLTLDSPTSKCRLEPSGEDSLCFLPSASGLFGCIELGSLIDVKPNIFCPIQNPTIARVGFRSCQEKEESIDRADFSNDQGRYLRSKKKKKDNEKVNDGSEDDGLAIVNGPLETPQELSYGGSNDRGLDLFVSEDCLRAGCSMVEDYVCFPTDLAAGQDEKTFILTFSAAVNGESQLFTIDVSVKRDDSLNICRVAETTCFEQ
jgi:hypothetical protein